MKAIIRCDCGQTLRVSSRSSSKSFHCPKCEQLFTVEASKLNGKNIRNLQADRGDDSKHDDEDIVVASLDEPNRSQSVSAIKARTFKASKDAARRRQWRYGRRVAIACGLLIAGVIVGILLRSTIDVRDLGLLGQSHMAVEVPNDTPLKVFQTYAEAIDQYDGDRLVQCLTNDLVTKHLGEVLLLRQPRLAEYESSESAEIRRQAAEHRAFFKKHSMNIHPRKIRRKLLLMGGSRKMLAEHIDMLKAAPLGTPTPSAFDSVMHEKDLSIDGSSAVGVIKHYAEDDNVLIVTTYKFTRSRGGG